jgi:hypothetical protein
MVLAPVEQRPSSPPDTAVAPHPDDAVSSLGRLFAHSRGRAVNVFAVEIQTRRLYYAVLRYGAAQAASLDGPLSRGSGLAVVPTVSMARSMLR